jgi:hypothetical protein
VYKLVRIAPAGKQGDIALDFAPEALIEAGIQLQRKRPSDQFGVLDTNGFFVWPPKLATAHINPLEYHPIVKQD